jgi:hypothetical protein
MGEQPRDHRERVAMRIARAISRLGIVIAVSAWVTWAITAFLGDRLPLLGLRTAGGVGVGLVWLVLVGPLFGLVISIGFRLLATIILGIALIALRRSHRTYQP